MLVSNKYFPSPFGPLKNIVTLKKYFQNVTHFCLEHFVFQVYINDYFLPLPAPSPLHLGIVSIAVKCLVMNLCFVAGVNRKASFANSPGMFLVWGYFVKTFTTWVTPGFLLQYVESKSAGQGS